MSPEVYERKCGDREIIFEMRTTSSLSGNCSTKLRFVSDRSPKKHMKMNRGTQRQDDRIPWDISACTDFAPFSFNVLAAIMRVLPESIISSTRIATCLSVA